MAHLLDRRIEWMRACRRTDGGVMKAGSHEGLYGLMAVWMYGCPDTDGRQKAAAPGLRSRDRADPEQGSGV